MSENGWTKGVYGFVVGIVAGAGGVIVGLKLITILQKRRTYKKSKREAYTLPSRLARTSLYRSPDPRRDGETAYNFDHLNTHMTHDTRNGRREQLTPVVNSDRDEQEVNTSMMEEIKECDPDNKKESETLLNLLYSIGESQSKRDYIVHRGISCNICNSNPLTGVRFKCVNCVDYDICSRCEPSCDHDLTHLFLKIIIPIPPLANPRTSLLPVFYPGKKSVEKNLPWQEALQLREKTHFDATYIEVLYEQFKSLCSHEKGITKDVFHVCLGPLTSKRNLVVEQLFRFYDSDGDGFINFDDFVHGMSIMAKGMKSERIKYVFKGYDLDDDGYISKDDFQQMMKAYHQLSMELVRDVVRSCEEEMMASYDDSGNRPISAVFNAPIPETGNNNTASSIWSKKMRNSSSEEVDKETTFHSKPRSNKNLRTHDRLSAVEAMTQDAITELVDQIMRNADLDKDGKLSEREFYDYVLTDTSLLAWFEAIDTVF